MWLCFHDRLPTMKLLHHIGISKNSICPVCNTFDKLTKPIFLQCNIARNFWLDLSLNIDSIRSFNQWLTSLKELHFLPLNTPLSFDWIMFFLFALWHLWTSQNNNVFKNEKSLLLISMVKNKVLKLFHFTNCDTISITLFQF